MTTISEMINKLYHDEADKRAVWNKAREVQGYHRDYVRMDDYGSLIQYSEYGNRNSPHGWEKDHYPVPKSLGGSDHISNLRPLHYRTNASLGGILGTLASS